tara:strand:+ start:140 stop:631 length:492 start_codon:yes stop_codon:yes gene_type:complete
MQKIKKIMFNKKGLCKFLVKAKKAGYASGDSVQEIRNNDMSKTITFKEGDWKYHDNYFGGEPYGGREVVFFKNKPVYIMIYYGRVNEDIHNVKKVYKILMNALRLIPEDKPYRGPLKYKESNFLYFNNFKGQIDNFRGKEIIKENGQEIYRARYVGGFIDQRK